VVRWYSLACLLQVVNAGVGRIEKQMTKDGLHGAIGTAPACIVEAILHVVEVEVLSGHCVAQT